MDKFTSSTGGAVIAIVGADGSGKTTLCEQMVRTLGEEGIKVQLRYGSKKADQYFRITSASVGAYFFLKRVNILGCRLLLPIAAIYLYLLHFPLEYVDNLFNCKKAQKVARKGVLLMFDRHAVDRILPLVTNHTVFSKNRAFVKRVSGFLAAKIQKLYGYLYFKTIPLPDCIIFLNIDADLLKQRRPDFYTDLGQAHWVRESYIQLSLLLREKTCQIVFDCNPNADCVIDCLQKRRD